MKYLAKFESFHTSMSKEEMIQHLCNHGWERTELEMMDESEIQSICSELPVEIAEGRIYDHYEQKNYMFFSNVENIHRMCEEIIKMNEGDVDDILSEHGWALDHMATSKDDIEEVYSFLMTHEPSGETERHLSESEKWIQKAIKKPGALRKKMGKVEGEKITASEIRDELSKLKKKDKDPDKEGLQLSKTDRTKHKQLVLAKTLRGMK
jgi:hypothetical protein